jgi:threonine dehydratase
VNPAPAISPFEWAGAAIWAIPDALIRAAIRRLHEEHVDDPETVRLRTDAFVAKMCESPIALATSDANAQDYEVPPALSSLIPRLCGSLFDVDLPTPLERAPEGLYGGRALFLKREDVHELGAFKWRGALPTIEAYKARGASAVVTASTGNHGAAVAWASQRAGLRAMVYAPAGASLAKLALIDGLGAEIRLAGTDLDFAKDEGKRFALEAHVPFFEDGVEPTQYDGYGVIADEILDQSPEAPAVVVVPVGNGALIAGIGRTIRRRSPATLVVGAAAKEAPVMALSFEARHPVACDRMATFADGLAVRVAIPEAVALVNDTVDWMLVVSEREMAHAIGSFAKAGIRAEGAAAAGLAALAQLSEVQGPIVLVVTGRNIDEELHRRAVEHPESFPE